MHTSIKMNTPCEFININPVNPLISECDIKVCYVGDKPNRNHSIITKEVAIEMANSLPGSPIVGYFNEHQGDFEEHNRIIDVSNGKFNIIDTTRPYGFVDLNAKPWFQKFLDDGVNEHEYLMVKGWLWTGQYPECQRVIDNGNNQSMELDEKTLNAHWTKDDNGNPQFFIINEAIISKLCILGEECEPCFEGSSITKATFSLHFEDSFKEQLFSMMNELKQYLDEGGTKKVFTRYAVEIGDALWSALYRYIEKTYPSEDCCWCSMYRIDGIFEDGEQKFVILQHHDSMKYYRLNFTYDSNVGLSVSDTLVEVTKSYTPAEEPQFAADAVEAYELEYKKSKNQNNDEEDEDEEETEENSENSEDNSSQEENDENDSSIEDEENSQYACGGGGSSSGDDSSKKKKKKKNYVLEEVSEYTELQSQYSALETNYNNLKAEHEQLKQQLTELTTFKAKVERKDKEAKIAEFWMLSDEDKADVVANIDTYSINDIEAQLAVICFRNKVSLTETKNNEENTDNPTTYNLNGINDSTPAWVKSALETAKRLK